jgi:hypothetical protein
MRRVCVLLCAVIALIALSAGCADSVAASPKPEMSAYFKVYDVSTDETAQYRYLVYTRGGDLLANGVTAKQPEFSFPNIEKWKGFLKLRVFEFGAGGDECRYFDIDGGRASGWFWYPVGESDSMVACVDDPAFAKKLYVQSIFDESYRREFTFEFAQGWGDVFRMEQQDPVISAVFSDDGTRLVVKYMYVDADGYPREKTETLELD